MERGLKLILIHPIPGHWGILKSEMIGGQNKKTKKEKKRKRKGNEKEKERRDRSAIE